MRVKILLYIPDEKSYGPATMVLDTIRVGYPTAFVDVYLNHREHPPKNGLFNHLAHERALKAGCQFHLLNRNFSHAEWLRDRIVEHASDIGDSEPLIFVDGDVGFHKCCEGWSFDKTFFAGYYIPSLFNDFTDCKSFDRLHTSHLWCLNVRSMWRGIDKNFPANVRPRADLCPLDLISPRVMFASGIPYFWDAFCGLYQMYGGTAFTPEHLEFYEHLTSASAFDVMMSFSKNPLGLTWLHTEGYKDISKLKGILWESHNQYYLNKASLLRSTEREA